MTQQSLSSALEENVLVSLCWSSESALWIASKVTPELFTTRHFRTIAKAAIDHVIKYSEAPRNHLPDLLEEELNKGETSAIIWKQIGRMEEMAPEIQTTYVVDQLDQFIELHKMRLAIMQASELIQKGDVVKAKEVVQLIDSTANDQPGIWMNDPTQALKFFDKEESEERFTLGIEALDIRNIRPERKTLFVLMAPTGRGKSMGLIQIASQASLVDKKKVLYITLELSDEKTSGRFVQSWCGMTKHEVADLRTALFKRDNQGNYAGIDYETDKYFPLTKQYRESAASQINSIFRGQKRLLVKQFPTSSLTIPKLLMYLEHLKRVDKFEPDMLVIDYANMMAMNYNQLRIEVGRLFRELRGIAVSRNIAVVTATQTNKASANSKNVDATMVAEDWSIIGTADIVVSICRTDEEEKRGLARLYVAKARDAADQFMVQITQNYATCNFATDSTYMNKIAFRDFNQMMNDEVDDD